MKSKVFLSIGILICVLIAACTKDNYDPPKSMLSGQVVYQGQPVGVRSNGVQLELWQPGYQFFTKIPIYVDQDGTFSAALFDGNYKLTRLKGNGPWADNTDTINIVVKGATTIDVPVQPYFVIANPTFQKSGTSVTASGKVNMVTAGKTVERVTFYIGSTQFVDATTNVAKDDKTGAALGDLSQPLTFSVAVPANVATKGYVYGRLGVKTTGVAELLYTPVQKIQL